MKYSNTTLRELKSRYKHVLLKCAFLNAALLMGFMITSPAMADTDFIGELKDNLTGLSDIGGNYVSPTTLYFVPKGYSANIGDGFTISQNTADSGILGTSGTGARSSLTIGKSTFSNNEAKFDGGAIASFGNLTITGTTFTQNIAQTLNSQDEIPIGGGAIALGAASKTTIQGGIFTENKSEYSAGAIGSRDFYNGTNVDATLDITGSSFTGNTAVKQGGAIDNYFYSSINNDKAVYIGSSTFTNNKAENGGAIYNHGSVSIQRDKTQVASIEINGATFIGNTATSAGGAIFNEKDATVILSGSNTFSGNTASGLANDIHNNGILNIFGDLTLDGGITGDGTIVFDKNASLTATLKTTTIEGESVTANGAALNLIIDNSYADGTYDFITKGAQDTFTIGENAVYDLSMKDGSILLAKKATETIAEAIIESGASAQEATAIATIAGVSSTDETANAVLSEISTALQTGDTQKATKIVKAINPEVAPVTRVATASNAVLGAVATRMSSVGTVSAPTRTGRSGGDVNAKLSPWVQGLYNKTHNSQGDGFDAYTQGFAFGTDVALGKAWTTGIGYAYTATDVKSDRKTQIYGDNFFAYAQYKPNRWYINAVASYGKSTYKQAGTFSTKYDADAYSAQALTGYDAGLIDTYTGVRYNYIKTDTYDNGVATIKSKDSQIGTFVLGTRLKQNLRLNKNAYLTPEFRLAGTYDFKSDNTTSTVAIIGSPASYTVTGDRMSRGAIEAGLGLTLKTRKVEVKFDYDATVRSENNTQAVNLKAIYHF